MEQESVNERVRKATDKSWEEHVQRLLGDVAQAEAAWARYQEWLMTALPKPKEGE